ncbi:MAG: hypothetical protein AB8B60_00655 [Sulfitobacter sp.]
MPFRYDIDISYIAPPELYDDPKTAALMNAAGIGLNARQNYVAKFRDPRTAAAAAGASQNVRDYFQASGIAFVPSGVNLPTGKFDARFEGHLSDVVQRLRDNLEKFDLVGQNWNGFDLGECVVAFAQAEPVATNRRMSDTQICDVPAKKRKPLIKGKSLAFLACAFAVFYVAQSSIGQQTQIIAAELIGAFPTAGDK